MEKILNRTGVVLFLLIAVGVMGSSISLAAGQHSSFSLVSPKTSLFTQTRFYPGKTAYAFTKVDAQGDGVRDIYITNSLGGSKSLAGRLILTIQEIGTTHRTLYSGSLLDFRRASLGKIADHQSRHLRLTLFFPNEGQTDDSSLQGQTSYLHIRFIAT
jgi:hypothetical protein